MKFNYSADVALILLNILNLASISFETAHDEIILPGLLPRYEPATAQEMRSKAGNLRLYFTYNYLPQ